MKEHFSQFSSADDMRKSLLATTAMQRVKVLDEQLGEALKQVGGGEGNVKSHIGLCVGWQITYRLFN